MNDTTFYQRINLLDDDALEQATVSAPRPAKRRMGKARRIAVTAALLTVAMNMIAVGSAMVAPDVLSSEPWVRFTMPLGQGMAVLTGGCALVTALMFGLAALKGRVTE